MLVVLVCALPFVFLGTSSLSTAFTGSFGSINGEDITEADLNMAIKASSILFGSSSADDLKSLDEDTFLSVFEGVPQFEINKSDFSSKR